MYKNSVENGRKWVLPGVLGAGCKHPFISMGTQPHLVASVLMVEVGVESLWDVRPFWDPLPGSPLMVFYAAK